MQPHSNPQIEALIKRLANGDEQKEWRLRKYQASIDRELSGYKDPIARMYRMEKLFWDGVKKFQNTIKGKE
jgi:hypothetical protein